MCGIRAKNGGRKEGRCPPNVPWAPQRAANRCGAPEARSRAGERVGGAGEGGRWAVGGLPCASKAQMVKGVSRCRCGAPLGNVVRRDAGGRGLAAGERSVKTLCRRVLVPWPHWALPGTLIRRTAYSYYTDAYTIGSVRGKLYNRPCYCSSCKAPPPGPAAARTCLTGIEERRAGRTPDVIFIHTTVIEVYSYISRRRVRRGGYFTVPGEFGYFMLDRGSMDGGEWRCRWRRRAGHTRYDLGRESA